MRVDPDYLRAKLRLANCLLASAEWDASGKLYAEIVEQHLDRWGKRRSLGVIAFSVAQEQAVNEEIERLAQKRQALERELREGPTHLEVLRRQLTNEQNQHLRELAEAAAAQAQAAADIRVL